MKIYLIIENNNNTVVGAYEAKADAEYALVSAKEAFGKYDITVQVEEIGLVPRGTKTEITLGDA